MARRWLPWVMLLAAALHAQGIARSLLPAQDGLKFLRVARRFQHEPWTDVVRDSDQHPLYPALIALAEPAVSRAFGRGPDSWRIAAQGVSALASIGLIPLIYGLSRTVFEEREALLAALAFVLLPLPAEVGRDTLSDATGLLGIVAALWLGERALRTRAIGPAVGAGLASGLGFLARPEAAMAPVAILVTAAALRCLDALRQGRPRRSARGRPEWSLGMAAGRSGLMAVVFLTAVGSYALVKGEVSEKLALRRSVALAPRPAEARRSGHWLPPGLDDPRWDFSPKEEMEADPRPGVTATALRMLARWGEGLGWVLAPLAIWGAWRLKAGPGRILIAAYVGLFGAVLLRHALDLGYLSARHTLSLVIVSLPWAAAALRARWRVFADRRGWDESQARRRGWVGLGCLIALGVALQLEPVHPSRCGHAAAGRWLSRNAGPGAAVLDTRGWATFVSGRRGYDYWHVRQALTDSSLAFVVVGADELQSGSRRAATLRAMLAYAAEPVADFPERRGGSKVGVRVYRYHRPTSWEGLRP